MSRLVLSIFTFLCVLAGASAEMGKNDAILNPNLAGEQELAALPHLSADLAKAIVAARPFLGMPALDEMLAKTLNDEQRGELYARLFIPLNLNTASDAEVRLIPGVGKKMAHEFEEYRPYTDLKQFRREIGKYVDEQEVARLEQYVFLPFSLNDTPEADFQAIPGVGKKMAHEFVEYRPYQDMAQFRREIGKYVDEREVARLERYVTLD